MGREPWATGLEAWALSLEPWAMSHAPVTINNRLINWFIFIWQIMGKSGTIGYHVIPCNTIQHHPIPSNTIQCHPVPSNTIRLHLTFSERCWSLTEVEEFARRLSFFSQHPSFYVVNLFLLFWFRNCLFHFEDSVFRCFLVSKARNCKLEISTICVDYPMSFWHSSKSPEWFPMAFKGCLRFFDVTVVWGSRIGWSPMLRGISLLSAI